MGSAAACSDAGAALSTKAPNGAYGRGIAAVARVARASWAE